MDFYKIGQRTNKKTIEVHPNFVVCKSKDLMVKAGAFYAIWDEDKNMWSTDEYDAQRLVDESLYKYKDTISTEMQIVVKTMCDYSSTSWSSFKKYLYSMPDNSKRLDDKIMFANSQIKKSDYVSKCLDYPLLKGECPSYKKIISTLYDPSERVKIEWAIGSIVSGDSKIIQKFFVLYGESGAGKSTILNIIQKLFKGYCATFEGKSITSSNNAFATEAFKSNPLVAIEHDGDLSKIEDNSRLNSIVSKEEILINQKYKPAYSERVMSLLFIGTNKPVKITDAKSGLIRRLIDIRPSGRKLKEKEYDQAMSQIEFELGAIAHHCLEVYTQMGKNYYNYYKPIDMIMQTDYFYNFVESYYYYFKDNDGVTLQQAYSMYCTFIEESMLEFKLPKMKFRDELKNYFKYFRDNKKINGVQLRNYYEEFKTDKFKNDSNREEVEEDVIGINLQETKSILDVVLEDNKAQYCNDNEVPLNKWNKVATKLKDLDTSKVHYVQTSDNHIVIDFDIKDDDGHKSLKLNLEAANKFPRTYAEVSKGGNGIHLHYNYIGDVNKLSRIYDLGIEVKVFNGDASLRRKLTKCDNHPIADINSGLPLKGETMIDFNVVKNEKAIRTLIVKNLCKEYHPGTKPSMDFIKKVLDEAYDSGVPYDVTDMRPSILSFANNSTNQSDYCLKLVKELNFKSKEDRVNTEIQEGELVFFDVEVFPNLFVLCFKAQGKNAVSMINPQPNEIEWLLKQKLVGFNCRRYDNHILYARYIGYTNEQLYNLSQRIINNSANCFFSEAYNISYTDIYDFSSKKQSLKKFEIELGIKHKELGLPWDKPVDESMWTQVSEYCINDVEATEAVFSARMEDYIARLILAELSGLTANDTTQTHAAKIIFGNDKRPQDKFVYTDLSDMFEGYKYEYGKSTYRGEEVGEGGYVYAEPGMYRDVYVLDVVSMHPTSLIVLNHFGEYTYKVKELLDARVAIKNKDYEKAKTMLGGILAKYLTDIEQSGKLSYALKIVINIIYGLTSAKFENKFKDPRNVDNIVAKRGALFMIELKHAVQEKGFIVAHIKTDSIKIPNATKEIIDFVIDFGKQYGYTFDCESIYTKMCLVNDAVYIAKNEKDEWCATGAQFAHPFVYKTLFSQKDLDMKDLYETKAVTTAMYLDLNTDPNKEPEFLFIGKVGSFAPVTERGGVLLREKEGKYYAVGGTKGYKWLSSEVIDTLGLYDIIDTSYHNKLKVAAEETISKFGDLQWFISDLDTSNLAPLDLPCGTKKYKECKECPSFRNNNAYECRLGYEILPF